MYFVKLLNFLSPILYKYKYQFKHPHQHDPYKQISALSKNLKMNSNCSSFHPEWSERSLEIKHSATFGDPLSQTTQDDVRTAAKNNKSDAKKILMVPFRVASGSNLFEGNCSLIFQKRGYVVDYLMCGQSVNYCEEIDSFKSKIFRCNLCFYEQNKFISSFKGNGVFINQYLSKEERSNIKKEIEGINLSQLENYLYLGVPIYKPLVSAMQLHLKKAFFSVVEHEPIIKGYIETIFTTIKALDNYFSKNTVELVCLSHGVYSTWGAVQQYCLSRSIRFVTYGRSYNGAGIIAAHDDSYLNEPMYEKNSNWNQNPLKHKEKEKITSYLRAKIGLEKKAYDYVSYHSGSTVFLTKHELYQKLNIDITKKIIALFPNIPWDGQTYRPALIFDNINSWIYETIDWFVKEKNCVLVIRTHPAEKRMPSTEGGLYDILQKRYGDSFLFEHVKLIPAESDIRSIAVAQHSLAVLLYGSTIGYETTFLKIPTILGSKFYYSDRDITFDPKTKEEYFYLIQKAIDGELVVDEARHERLLQYAYHYNFRRVMPETLMNLKGLNFDGYKYHDLDALVNDQVINKFIDQCLSGEKFYFDECY